MTKENSSPILMTGSSGLVGSRFVKQFGKVYKVQPVDISNPKKPVDITDFKQVLKVFSESKAEYVIHCAAFTDVAGAWDQRGDKTGPAYRINVDGTKNIVKACEETKKKLIHISTAYVFDGEKKTAYVESDKPSPIEWYGETKFLSEEAVQNSQVSWTILRIDQPFRSDPFIKMDVVHRAIAKLQAKSLPPMFVNHYFGPTFIDDLTKVFDFVIRKNITGLVHATSGESWTDYDFVQKIKEAHGFQEEILKGDLNEYLKTTNRPYQKNTVLDSRKLNSQLDFELTSIEDALSQVTF